MLHPIRMKLQDMFILYLVNKSSNIGKTTTTNQYKRVPDFWRPGSVKIKRYYAKKVD